MRLYLVIIIIPLLFLAGCNGQERKQAAANAIAGIEAVENYEVPISQLAPALRQWIASAAGTLLSNLPPPQITAEEIAIDPEPFIAAAEESQRQIANSGFGWLAIGGWILGAAGVAAGIIKALGIGGPLVQVFASIVENRAQKNAKEQQIHLAQVGKLSVEIIEELDYKPLKKAISHRVTPEQDAAIRRTLDEKSESIQSETTRTPIV